MEIKLCNTSDPKEKLNKTVTEGVTLNCLLKENTSIIDPVLIIESSQPVYDYNYVYIPMFRRYYYRTDIRSIGFNRWEFTAHVDVLKSYYEDIISNSAIMEGTEQVQINKYLPDENVFITNCKRLTNIINFPSGLNETGEFILITAGG